MNCASGKRISGLTFLLLSVSLFLAPRLAFSYRYRTVEEAIDKKIAQIQPKLLNRTELTEAEKAELAKWGYTGLEIMTYAMATTEPGMNCVDCKHGTEGWARDLRINRRGHIRERVLTWRWIYHYPKYSSYMDELDPGDGAPEIGEKNLDDLILVVEPPYARGTAQLAYHYTESFDRPKDNDAYLWLPNLRRVRRLSAADKEDGILGLDLTYDDLGDRKPFEENHRIIGKDVIEGKYDSPISCWVIESKSKYPDYYLKRRLTWIAEKRWTIEHEEQFDRQNRLFKVANRYWHKLEPWGDWARYRWDVIHLGTGHRSYLEYLDRKINKDWPPMLYSMDQLRREEIWGRITSPLKPVKSVSELPPPPQIKWDFWKKIGEKPEVIE